jgi:tRNA pseudouridine13 synthase
VLEPYGLAWSDLRIKHLKDIFFSKGTRPCLVFPEALRVEARDDELHPGRQALRLSFELAKGAYATILVKRLTDGLGGDTGL